MEKLLRTEFSRLPGVVTETVSLEGTDAKALRVRVRPTAAIQVFCSGHYDTVYGATDPFQKCTLLSPEKLRGPGVSDMKGGLVVLLAALQAFEETPHAANLGYELLFGPDEEIGSEGTSALFSDIAARHRFGLVFEPARPNGDLVHSRKGTANFTITCRGRAAHAANPQRAGRNAIAALAEVLVSVHQMPDAHPDLMVNIGNICGGGPATNVVPDLAEAKLDVRITRETDREIVDGKFRELAAAINARDGFSLEITGGFNRPPKVCLPLEEIVFESWKSAAKDLGLAPFSWVHAGGGSDGNNLSAAGLPCLDGLGPIGDRLHSPDEWCHLPSIVERSQLAALVLHRAAAGDIKLSS